MANDLNPLRAEAHVERTPPPCSIVIFGVSGDLAKRKLVPALFNLARERHLPGGFSIVGYSRSSMSDEALRSLMYEAVIRFSNSSPPTTAEWDSFAAGMFYCQGEYDDIAGYARLAERLATIDAERGTSGNRIFYLSTPPALIGPIIDTLGASGLAQSAPGSWTRIVIEKPLGYDLATARELNARISRIFREDQVYRIDHYRAKETVQNIVALRFANGIFEPVWNRRYIDHVQITAAETVGVEGRGGYYESAGAVRDMLQNHLLQLLALVGMEPPTSLDADAIRDEAVKVAKAIRPIPPGEVDAHAVRGQYTAGWVSGKMVPGYREEEGVSPTSTTETYAAIRLEIDNWRWAGVPFFLRSGKRLTKRAAEIAVQFRQVPMRLFATTEADMHEPNLLVMKIQPDEGLTLRLAAKLPGHAIHLRSVNMEFRYGTSFGIRSSEAYERLLLDCMFGDATLFTRRDMVEIGWALMMPVLDHWAASGERNLHFYEAGTWGPEAANQLMGEGRVWRRL